MITVLNDYAENLIALLDLDGEIAQFEYLIEVGRNASEFNESEKITKNEMFGCLAKVWILQNKEDNHYYYSGDSDAAIVKGLVTIITEAMSGHTQKEIKEIAKILKPFRYDLIINLRSRNSTEKLVGLLSGRWKININLFCRERFTDVMVGFKTNNLSIIHSEFEFLKTIGFKPKKYGPEIFLKNEEIENARHFLNANDFDVSKKLVIFHPFSSDPLREWGIDKYIDLAKHLDKVCKCNILFVGAKNEIDRERSRISSQIPRCALHDDSVGKTAAIINESSLLIGGESLFAHVSASLKIPTIVIQGPHLKPYLGVHFDDDVQINQKHFFMFSKELPCRDLLNTGCGSCSDQICFDFSVDEILQQALKMLN